MIINSIEPAGAPESLSLKGVLEISFAANQQPSSDKIARMKKLLQDNTGESKVHFLAFEENGDHHVVRAGTQWNVALSSELIDEFNTLVGPNSTRVLMQRGPIEREAQPAWKTAR